jgi:hypothetical protein
MLPMTNSADTVDTVPANESLTSPERSLALLDDIGIPSTPQLNQVMNSYSPLSRIVDFKGYI